MADTKAEANTNDILMFRGKPLVRVGNVIYYGYRSDPYSIEIEILTTDTLPGADGASIELTDRVQIRLMQNNPDGTQNVMSSSEQNGLCNAIDIAKSWLDRFIRT